MLSPQDLEAQRAAKAVEGARLLTAKDYEGAIAACTEALELDPGSLGARRTRAEALRRLGRESEATAELNILRDRQDYLHEEGDPRPEFCARLGRIGVHASSAGRKEGGSRGGEEWLIDISEGPIHRILISSISSFYDGEVDFVRRIDYLVRDPRISPRFSLRGIEDVVVPSLENLQFRAKTTGMPRFDGADGFYFDPDRCCLWMTDGAWRGNVNSHELPKPTDAPAAHAPSRLQWDQYGAFASEVLAAPVLHAYLADRQPTEEVCAAICELGADARVVKQGPFTDDAGVRWVQHGFHSRSKLRVMVQWDSDQQIMKQDVEEPPLRWIQIAQNPIRWVELGLGTLKPGTDSKQNSFLLGKSAGIGFGTLCYVPDARITADSARVRMVSERIKSFPVLGRVERVRWHDVNSLRPDIDVPGHTQTDKDFSKILSENLGQNLAATEAIKAIGTDLCVVNDLDSGCWILAVDDRPMSKWTRELWDGCRAMAKALLGMPMPTEE